MPKRTIILVISILFMVLFLYTGISKLLEYKEFNYQLRQLSIFKSFVAELTWMIPGIELAVCIMLIIKRWRLQALFTSFILMTLFTFYVIAISQLSYYISCSCGGVLEMLPNDMHIVLNIALSLLALTALYLEKDLRRKKCEKTRSLTHF